MLVQNVTELQNSQIRRWNLQTLSTSSDARNLIITFIIEKHMFDSVFYIAAVEIGLFLLNKAEKICFLSMFKFIPSLCLHCISKMSYVPTYWNVR
jgi:hypothetical protein